MFINDEKYFKFLINNNMTAEQFLFCYALSTIDRNHKFINRYVSEVNSLTDQEFNDLVERGYMLDFNADGHKYHDSLVVTDKFKESIIVDEEDAFNELWKTYPMRLQQGINGNYPMAKTTEMGKEALQRKYAKYISSDMQKHLRVMEVLKWFKERQKITVGIEKFVKNQLWEDWETEMEADSGGNEFGIEVR